MKTSKQAIRAAALSLFADRGYEAVSVRDIAETLSLTKGALYRHYTDKRAILDAVLENADITASLSPPHDAETLAAFGLAAFERLCTGESAALFRLLTVGQYGDPVLRYAYEKTLWQLPLSQISPALTALPDTRRGEWALLFWAPLLALAERCYTTEAKQTLSAQATEHCRSFAARLTVRDEERKTRLLCAAAYGRRRNPFAETH